jgi:hypothetical protein
LYLVPRFDTKTYGPALRGRARMASNVSGHRTAGRGDTGHASSSARCRQDVKPLPARRRRGAERNRRDTRRMDHRWHRSVPNPPFGSAQALRRQRTARARQRPGPHERGANERRRGASPRSPTIDFRLVLAPNETARRRVTPGRMRSGRRGSNPRHSRWQSYIRSHNPLFWLNNEVSVSPGGTSGGIKGYAGGYKTRQA